VLGSEASSVAPSGDSPLGALLSFLVPSRCAGCGAPRTGVGGGGLCPPCWASLPPVDLESACPHCALPGRGGPCARCLREAPPVARAAALGLYAGPLKRLITAYKFRGFDILAAPAAERLSALARAAGLAAPEALVPVPSTKTRNRDRGFDPARLLAEETGRRLRRPVRVLLERRRDTPVQSALPAHERDANVAGAFRSRPAAGQSLLLVDDVVTTGATAFEAARTLLRAGASRVDLLVLARTPDFETDPRPEPA
jgi:ComF family protein